MASSGTTDCPVEGVRAFVDDGECSACGAPVPGPTHSIRSKDF